MCEVGTIKSEIEFAVLKTAGRCLAVKCMRIHEMPMVTARIMAQQDETRCTVLYIKHDWIFFSSNESCAFCCMLCFFIKVTQ